MIVVVLFFMVITYRNIESDEDEESENEYVGNRIQQPNVRINPNLVKIKMEQDYNPIVVPKEESSEENETETGQGFQLQSTSQQMVSKRTNHNIIYSFSTLDKM